MAYWWDASKGAWQEDKADHQTTDAGVYQFYDTSDSTWKDDTVEHSDTGDSEDSSTEIPEGTYHTADSSSESWTGLPSEYHDYAKNILGASNAVGSAMTSAANSTANLKPFEWFGADWTGDSQSNQGSYAMNSQGGFLQRAMQSMQNYPQEAEATRQSSYGDVLRTFGNDLNSYSGQASNALASRGLGGMNSAARAYGWGKATDDAYSSLQSLQQNFENNMGTYKTNAANIASTLAQAMAANNVSVSSTQASNSSSMANAIANVLQQLREQRSTSTSHEEWPLEPYQLIAEM